MSLSEFQRAFADLIASPALCLDARRSGEAVFAAYALTERERRRLSLMVRDEGMSVNCTLYRVNRLTPLYSVLPLTCALLGERLRPELVAFWASCREATQQYGREAAQFGEWLRGRIACGALDGGPIEDVLAFELAAFAVRTAPPGDVVDGAAGGRTRWIRFRYDPALVLEGALDPHVMEPLPEPEWLLLDASGRGLQVYRFR